MKAKIILSIILFCFKFSLLAQFATVGSVWHYSFNDDVGYTRIECIADSVSPENGKTYHILERHFKNFTPYITTSNEIKERIILLQEDGKVYFEFEDSFYLLYDFSVSIGEVVIFHAMAWNDVDEKHIILPAKYRISDVSEVLYENNNLKRVTATLIEDESYLADYEYLPTYIYTEKLGYGNDYTLMIHKPRTQDYDSSLRCYADDDFTYIRDDWQKANYACDYVNPQLLALLLPDINNNDWNIKIVSGKIIVQNKLQQNILLDLLDINGKIIKSIYSDNNELTIDTTVLYKGIYILSIKDGKSYYYKKVLL